MKVLTVSRSIRLLLTVTTCLVLASNKQAGAQLQQSSFLSAGDPAARKLVYAKNNDFHPGRYAGRIPCLRHLFTIELKDGTVYKVNTRIKISKQGAFLLFKQDGAYTSVLPKDTKQISIINNYRKMVGIPGLSDSAWLFQVSKGPLMTYSVAPEWNTIFISAVQKDTSLAPVQIDQSTILKMVSDHPKALQLAQKRRLMSAIMTYNKK